MEPSAPCNRRLAALLRHFAVDANPSFFLGSQHTQGSPPSSSVGPVVIGAMVLDIHAIPSSHQLQPGTTTPGVVRYVRGGVGRNIAECMSKLGMVPFFISVVGKDMAGDALLAHWQSLGLTIDGILQCSSAATPVVSAIFDGKGELAGAVADTQITEKYLTAEWIGQFADQFRRATVLVLDANLSPSALEAACRLAESANLPIWFEPVSVSKSVRYGSISHHLTYVSPNEAELVAMAVGTDGTLNKITSGDSDDASCESLIQNLEPYILKLLQKGIKHVVLTLGRHGVALCSKSSYIEEQPMKMTVAQSNSVYYLHFPALPAAVVSLSGAGDCFVAGALAALCMHWTLPASMALGIAVARQAIQSEFNVPLTLSPDELIADARNVLASGS